MVEYWKEYFKILWYKFSSRLAIKYFPFFYCRLMEERLAMPCERQALVFSLDRPEQPSIERTGM